MADSILLLSALADHEGLEDINAKLQQWYRASEGREATPSAGCIDSQSTKIDVRLSCTEDVGIDSGKLVRDGRENKVPYIREII